jgi:hypothetical protein
MLRIAMVVVMVLRLIKDKGCFMFDFSFSLLEIIPPFHSFDACFKAFIMSDQQALMSVP